MITKQKTNVREALKKTISCTGIRSRNFTATCMTPKNNTESKILDDEDNSGTPNHATIPEQNNEDGRTAKDQTNQLGRTKNILYYPAIFK